MGAIAGVVCHHKATVAQEKRVMNTTGRKFTSLQDRQLDGALCLRQKPGSSTALQRFWPHMAVALETSLSQ